ncbi:hypothetical protein Q5P01_001084 [Channa striata]|uniref:Uncharacterized protein n=1 Tax=Channa striata TaxID=64152 RepID=A0AA88NQ76_CHASR|nr:hypothetical protein Q5P01_001084 [Channa striata]
MEVGMPLNLSLRFCVRIKATNCHRERLSCCRSSWLRCQLVRRMRASIRPSFSGGPGWQASQHRLCCPVKTRAELQHKVNRRHFHQSTC